MKSIFVKARFIVIVIFLTLVFASFIGSVNAFSIVEMGKYTTAGYAYDIAFSADYLYIADTTGLQIYNNYNNIDKPILVASFSDLRRLNSIAIYGEKGYVVSEGQIYLLNMTNPIEPKLVRQLPFYSSAKAVAAYSDYLFATNSGLLILNASSEFKIVGQFTYTEDSEPEYLGVAAFGDLACVASAKLNESGFRNVYLVNIANPSNPWLMSKFSTVSTAAFPHYPQDVAIQGNYVYVVDKRFGVFAVNISNRYAPEIVAQFNPFQEEPIGIAIARDKAFVTTGTNLHIFKLNDEIPPDIAIASPREGEVFLNDTITIQGTAKDDSGIREVMVNGLFAGNITWSCNLTLLPGLNNITITAIDYHGNVQVKTVRVNYIPPTSTPTLTPTPTLEPLPTPTLTPTPKSVTPKSVIGFEINLAFLAIIAILMKRY